MYCAQNVIQIWLTATLNYVYPKVDLQTQHTGFALVIYTCQLKDNIIQC